MNWQRRELCSPGCCGAVITNLLSCLPPWPSWGFPNPRSPLRSPFSSPLSSPISPLLSTDLSRALETVGNPFPNERQRCDQPACDTTPCCGCSFLNRLPGPRVRLALLSALLLPTVSAAALPEHSFLPWPRVVCEEAAPYKSPGGKGSAQGETQSQVLSNLLLLYGVSLT